VYEVIPYLKHIAHNPFGQNDYVVQYLHVQARTASARSREYRAVESRLVIEYSRRVIQAGYIELRYRPNGLGNFRRPFWPITCFRTERRLQAIGCHSPLGCLTLLQLDYTDAAILRKRPISNQQSSIPSGTIQSGGFADRGRECSLIHRCRIAPFRQKTDLASRNSSHKRCAPQQQKSRFLRH